jgi:hypothetical protein
MRRAAIIAILAARALLADGGTVVLRQTSGPFVVTAFLAPGDLSVLVQDAKSLEPVLDAGVIITIDGAPIRATHELAQNKLLYAAPITQGHSLEVTVRKGAASITAAATIDMPMPARPAYWNYAAIPPIAIALFALNRFLRARQRR